MLIDEVVIKENNEMTKTTTSKILRTFVNRFSIFEIVPFNYEYSQSLSMFEYDIFLCSYPATSLDFYGKLILIFK